MYVYMYISYLKMIYEMYYRQCIGFVLARVEKPQFPLATTGISSAYYNRDFLVVTQGLFQNTAARIIMHKQTKTLGITGSLHAHAGS